MKHCQQQYELPIMRVLNLCAGKEDVVSIRDIVHISRVEACKYTGTRAYARIAACEGLTASQPQVCLA